MPLIQLPNNQSALIVSRDEITERQSRAISEAMFTATATSGSLNAKGFNNDDPETWHLVGADDFANLRQFQSVLIVQMVKSWTLGELPTIETVIDIPKGTFDLLSEACAAEFLASGVSVEVDPDPKATTPDSNA